MYICFARNSKFFPAIDLVSTAAKNCPYCLPLGSHKVVKGGTEVEKTEK